MLLTPDNYYSIDYLIDEEICIDISEYRDYAPDFFDVYDSDELFAGEITSDSGRIVSMWGRYTLANTIIGIRADWLEALELDVPTTYDELTETLRAFQVEYDTVDTICLMQSGYMANGSGILTGGYGVQSPESSTDLPWQVTEDGEVVMSYTLEGYEKYFTLINSWYEEGIISDNFLSWTNPGNFDDPILNNEAGVVATRAANFSASYQSGAADESFELRPIADVTETEGQTITTGGGRGILASGGMAVTTSCEYPEEAIMYLNWYFTDEGHMAANFGEPDVMYTIDGDEITYTDFVMNNPDGFSYKVVLGLYTTYMGVGYDIDERQVTSAFTLRYETDMYTTWASNRTEDSVCYGTMTSEESDSYNEILADIVTYCNEKTLSYITGAESLDTYDEFIENLYDMGLQDLIDIKQAAYDRYIAR